MEVELAWNGVELMLVAPGQAPVADQSKSEEL